MSDTTRRFSAAKAFRCLLIAIGLGFFVLPAMAARDCWAPNGQTANIGSFYPNELTFNCYDSAEAALAAVIASANQNGQVPRDFGSYKTTASFVGKSCALWRNLARPGITMLCDYVSSSTYFYPDGVVKSGSEMSGALTVLLFCGEYNTKAPIGSTTSSCKPVLDKFGTAAPSSCPARIGSPNVGNPVDVLTGIKRQTESLLTWGRGHSLSMTYVGTQPMAGWTLQEGGAHSFGRRWFSNLHRQGMYESDHGYAVYLYQREGGVWKRFRQDVGSDDASQRDPMPVGKSVGSSYYWLYRDVQTGAIEVYRYEDYTLVSIAYIDGRRLDFTGSVHPATTGQLEDRYLIDKVTDESGRTVSFQYKSVDKKYSAIEQVTDPAGLPLRIAYDAIGNLTSVTYADQKAREYLYENSSFPVLLTGRIDEGGGRIGTYRYDNAGRAVETQTGSLAPWTIRWDSAPPDPAPQEYYDPALDVIIRIQPQAMPTATQARVTSPDGVESVLGGAVVGRSAMVTSRSQPAGAGCEASTSNAVFDAAGNVVQSDDFNGGRSCMAYDATRGLELRRFEGLTSAMACTGVNASSMPVGARLATSQWHPDWRLKTKTAEPRRITTLVYNGQPDPFNGNVVASCAPADAKLPDGKPIVVLCKRVEQATTDETGALGFNATLQAGVPARTTSWTYNATGQVLTETDSLNRVAVTNEYYADTTADHTKGDLKSSKNAAGHVTNFMRYDAYGKPLEAIDANLTSTIYTYDPRQRLTSVTTSGSTTTYEYWPTGLLKKSSQPDGSAVNYEYDDAHRLVAVSDTRGNRIAYALDANGNRTREDAKDPLGTLKRTMSRAFDALGRAQQTTGRE